MYHSKEYLWSKYQLNLTLFTEIIAPNPSTPTPKWTQLGPEPKKLVFCSGQSFFNLLYNHAENTN